MVKPKGSALGASLAGLAPYGAAGSGRRAQATVINPSATLPRYSTPTSNTRPRSALQPCKQST